MEIGSKLKQARIAASLTQEAVAEAVGVSRQTVSNWENGKTYPDIVSVIKLSDLYAISLDALLKGDARMTDFLEESTNVVKSRKRLTLLVVTATYLVIWTLCMLLYWCWSDPGDAMAVSLIIFYIALPLATLVLSFFLGKDIQLSRWRFLSPLLFGFMLMMAEYCTFTLSNMLWVHVIRAPEWPLFLAGAVISAVGLAIGVGVNRLSARIKSRGKTE